MAMQWFDNNKNIIDLAVWMHERGEWHVKNLQDDPITRLIKFFDKPWKFDDSWEEFQNSLNKEDV